jgi:hypothetical protein
VGRGRKNIVQIVLQKMMLLAVLIASLGYHRSAVIKGDCFPCSSLSSKLDHK